MTYTPTKTESSTDGSCKHYRPKKENVEKLKKLIKKIENGN